jgi:hypothetical protein
MLENLLQTEAFDKSPNAMPEHNTQAFGALGY